MKQILFLFIALIPLLSLQGQSELSDTILTQNQPRFKHTKGVISVIDRLLNEQDTSYVSPNKYKFAFMLENSNWYEYYLLQSSGEKAQSITISPNMNYKIGAYFGWKWIFIGWSIDIKDLFRKEKASSKKTEFGLSLYSSVVGGDIYLRKSGSDFKLRNTSGILSNPEQPYQKGIDGFSVDIKGLNAYWVINHKRFSYPAAFSQSTNQRRSAGSWIAGFSYSTHQIHFDYEKLPSVIIENLSDALKFREISYSDYSLNFGYAYNWVFARNCLASLSVTPAIAYKKSHANDNNETRYKTSKNVNFDLITRAGVTYNNSDYFIGASLVMHTYDYRSNNFELNNSFGTVRIYAGFNFIKKKKYRNE